MIIYDYADLRVAMLSRMFQRRKRGYHSIGYDIGSQSAVDDIQSVNLTQQLPNGRP